MSNQASGDELRAEILTEFKQVHKLAPADYTENCTNVVMKLIRTEKLKLLNKLDKSMPTDEQLTTKYGYHMPDKQYGYKLALHDIREVLAKLEAEL